MDDTFQINAQFHGLIEFLNDSKDTIKLSIFKKSSKKPLLEMTLGNTEFQNLVFTLSSYLDAINLEELTWDKVELDHIKPFLYNFYQSIPASKYYPNISAIIKEQSSNKFAEVYIAIPQEEIDLFVIEQVQNACGDFMEALGYKLKEEEEPVYGSFFQRILFKFKKSKTKEEVEDIYSKAKTALERKYLDLPTAEINQKLAEAASCLIKSVESLDEVCIRLQDIFIIKVTVEGRKILLVKNNFIELETILQSNPKLLDSPRAMYEMIRALEKNVGDENPTVTPVEGLE